MKRCFGQEKGFTFVELMITLVFLSIALLAISSQFPLGLRVSESAEALTLATNLSQEMMEEIRSIPWNTVHLYDGRSENPPEDIDGNPMDGEGGRPNYRRYRRDVIVRFADPVTLDSTSTATSLKWVQVSVTNTVSDQTTSLVLIMSERP